ncbi:MULTISPECIES: UxaA family hydrolase [unclassified Halanaerobium]|uniref:UxaA family hydrolase n=1 Tax=unclassified Halanaerobium TaxID=2641197 RepID=UPI000DF27F93|nr:MULTISPECIES: UxaA family hydrolase [unclassified Halanaerobium]RCW42006.1 altronate dehydratase large subunit [Halanaerobium sp. MA284_MarDTE_T2]RCW79967.1 altronate dehydratase large subunit [Halanaerobium sp. DL-01]
MKFMGYRREDGTAGVRNFLAVIPSVFCANKAAEQIAANIDNAVSLTHSVGCSQVGEDLEQTARTLKNLATHPNIGGVLIVGLGCERFTPQEFYDTVKASGKPVEKVVIQEEGDSIKAVKAGTEKLYQLNEIVNSYQRVEIDVSELIIGLECGGTDATSGIAANPAIGKTSDILIGEGGSSVFSETTELLGAEHILKRRCVNDEVADKMLNSVERTEGELARATASEKYRHRSALISTGNFDGGVSTVVEKALGNIHKTGSAPITGAVRYAEKLQAKGLNFMDTPGQDGESTTGLAAGGAQIVLFTTGRGTPTGFPTVPVIKITGNDDTYQKMKFNLDVNAGKVILGEEDIDSMGKIIFDYMLEVASGKKTKAEVLGHDELFNIPRVLNYCGN